MPDTESITPIEASNNITPARPNIINIIAEIIIGIAKAFIF